MVPAVSEDELREACYQTRAELSPRLHARCRLIVRPPFVLAGDLSQAELSDWYESTVAPAARAMQRAYFQVPPHAPITLLLFSGKESYEHHALRLFGDRGVSVYGYFKPQYRTVLLNIGTGGGTLVHELTHALISFDFPDVPDWFNEGLASLHENCRIRRDESGLDGLPNWRLPVLQKAIAERRLRPLRDLMRADDFRSRHEGLNYAQARYFCAWLQHQGRLEEYYRRFRENQAFDPHGDLTFARLFPQQSWAAVEIDFRRWAAAQE